MFAQFAAADFEAGSILFFFFNSFLQTPEYNKRGFTVLTIKSIE